MLKNQYTNIINIEIVPFSYKKIKTSINNIHIDQEEKLIKRI